MVASWANNQKEHILRVLEAVRKRPGMFIFPVTLTSLRNFICGYNCTNLFKEGSTNYFSSSNPYFYDWIAMKERTRYAPNMGWVEAIMKNASSEQEGFDRFFQYLDEYLARKPVILHEYELTKKNRAYYLKNRDSEDIEVPCKAQIVSYDKNVDGVFVRSFNDEGKQINNERHYLNEKAALSDWLRKCTKKRKGDRCI